MRVPHSEARRADADHASGPRDPRADARGLRPDGPDDCIAPLTALQPYQAAALHGYRAEHHALVLLSSFQNADKHRELIDAPVGLSKVEVEINGETTYAVPAFKNGTVVVSAYEQVDVKVKGVATIGIKRGNDVWGFDMLVKRLTAFIADELLPRLEPLLK